MVELKKFQDYALKGAAALIVLGFLSDLLILFLLGADAQGLDTTGKTGAISPALAGKIAFAGVIGLALLAIYAIIAVAVGYFAVKNKGADLVEAGLGSAVALGIASIAGIIISLAISMAGIRPVIAGDTALTSNAATILMGAICIPAYAIAGFVLGAIGGVIAQHTGGKPEEKKKK